MIVEIALGAALFAAIVMTLVAVVLASRRWLLPSGEATLTVNGERRVTARRSETLLAALEAAGIHVPAGCGGKGICGQCRVEVAAGGPPLPVERSRLSRREVAHGVRLACQVTVRDDMSVRVPDDVLGVEQWTCRVRSARWLTTLIREVVLELPPGVTIPPPAGRYVLVTCPPYRLSYAELAAEPAIREAWEPLGLLGLTASAGVPTTRAYSMANHPGEKGIVMLIVRLATPPPAAPDAPPGVVSSWLCGVRPGEEVEVAGPYGYFFVAEGDAEMVFIGGGAGMAPMRAHIFDQLERQHTRRPMSFWYGARSRRELFYVEDFDRLQAEHENFRWTIALSEPRPEDAWTGETGFIHDVLYRRYLASHPAPETCQYYLCGPPLMVRAVRVMLDELGVGPERIKADDFGTAP